MTRIFNHLDLFRGVLNHRTQIHVDILDDIWYALPLRPRFHLGLGVIFSTHALLASVYQAVEETL